MISRIFTATAALALFATTASAATFNGDTAQFQFAGNGFGTVLDETVLIGAGNESSFNNRTFIDVDDLTVTITFDLTGVGSVGAETQWTILGLDAEEGFFIDGISLSSGNARLVDDTSFTNNSATFSFFDFTSAQSPGVQSWVFDVSVAAVPLPATLPLLALGFGALGSMKRRRKTAA